MSHRQLQIERDALIIIANEAMLGVSPLISWAERGHEGNADALGRIESCVAHTAGLRRVTWGADRMDLGCVTAFNESAWLGESGILEQYRSSDWRGHRCGAEDIEALVWGCAGRVGCTLYRGEQSVALLGVDEDGRAIGLGSTSGDPIELVEIVWRAADLGQDLRASMRRDDSVTHPAVAAWRAQQSAAG